jgi:hypothetical protein
MADRKLLVWFKREETMSADQQQILKDYYEKRGYSAQDVALAIIGGGLVNAIALLAITGPFTFWNTIVGFFILCILQAFHPAPFSRRFLKIAFAAIWSFSFLSTIGVVFNMLFDVASRGAFPDTDAVCFISFPASIFHRSCSTHPSTTPATSTFTPFNAYDLSYFLAWILISIIVYWLFFVRGKNKSTKSASP